jgi:hypothetical protein
MASIPSFLSDDRLDSHATALSRRRLCGVVGMGKMTGMLHSDLAVVMSDRCFSAANKPPILQSRLLFHLDSHSFGLWSSAVLLILDSCFVKSQGAHHVAVFHAPFTTPCPAIRSGQCAGFVNRHLWTRWTMSRAVDHECRRCTASSLQLFLSIRIADQQYLRRREHDHD